MNEEVNRKSSNYSYLEYKWLSYFYFHELLEGDFTVEPPLADTSIQRTPLFNGQIFCPNYIMTKDFSSIQWATLHSNIGPRGFRSMEVPL